eukprot:m.32306 g.32306  ORF g.32306 m.32306 type:complete len:104 (+) comp12145_c0_seq1:744-1055(+)
MVHFYGSLEPSLPIMSWQLTNTPHSVEGSLYDFDAFAQLLEGSPTSVGVGNWMRIPSNANVLGWIGVANFTRETSTWLCTWTNIISHCQRLSPAVMRECVVVL